MSTFKTHLPEPCLEAIRLCHREHCKPLDLLSPDEPSVTQYKNHTWEKINSISKKQNFVIVYIGFLYYHEKLEKFQGGKV